MNPSQTFEPDSTQESNLPPPFKEKRKSSKKVIISAFVLLLIGGAAYGGFTYGQSQTDADSTATTTTTVVKKSNVNSVHFVASNGYPFDIGAKKIFTTKLGVPAGLQAVRVASTNNNSGDEQYFTDKYNDELARWFIGNPDNPVENGGGISQISILAISKSWLATNLPSNLAADSERATGYKLNTSADKQKFLQTIKTNSEACAKDTKKGFATKDGSFKVCYTLYFGREGYSPMVTLSGYGEKESIPMYFTGLINIFDDTPMANQEAEQKAISDAKEGKYTTTFAKSWNSLLTALQETTLTTKDNPAVKTN